MKFLSPSFTPAMIYGAESFSLVYNKVDREEWFEEILDVKEYTMANKAFSEWLTRQSGREIEEKKGKLFVRPGDEILTFNYQGRSPANGHEDPDAEISFYVVEVEGIDD